jgi:two-component system sensor histidine kinase DegS
MSADPTTAKSELAELKDRVAITLGDTRQFIFDLRPMILDDLGLIPTLRRHMESLANRTGVNSNMTVSGIEGRLPAQVEIALFRIAQEALENAVTHGKADSVQVNLEYVDGLLRLTIEDNGSGFAASEVLSASSASGLYGITGMRERANMLGGDLYLDSTSGKGAKVRAEIPI